jgi:hypothetical protein
MELSPWESTSRSAYQYFTVTISTIRHIMVNWNNMKEATFLSVLLLCWASRGCSECRHWSNHQIATYFRKLPTDGNLIMVINPLILVSGSVAIRLHEKESKWLLWASLLFWPHKKQLIFINGIQTRVHTIVFVPLGLVCGRITAVWHKKASEGLLCVPLLIWPSPPR